MIVKTSNSKNPIIEIPIEATIVGEPVFIPAKLFLGYIQAGEIVTRDVSIYSRKGNEFLIKSYDLNGLPNVIDNFAGLKSKKHNLTLKLKAPEKSTMVKDYIDFLVESDSEQIVQLPIIALIRNRLDD